MHYLYLKYLFKLKIAYDNLGDIIKKIKIGIVPTHHSNNLDPYDDYYSFISLYINKINEAGGIAQGILVTNDHISEEDLDYDAFLLPGGSCIKPYVYEVIIYAMKHNKPLLGICMGMQALGIFSLILENTKINKIDFNNFSQFYNQTKVKNSNSFLQKIGSNKHYVMEPTYDNTDELRHLVNIKDECFLSEIYGIKRNVISMHNYKLLKIGKDFKISALSEDGIIEGIEYNKPNYFIIGIQFHPELEKDTLIFKRLIDEAKLRIKD